MKIFDYLAKTETETRLEKLVYTFFDKIIIGLLTAVLLVSFQQRNAFHEKKKDALLAVNKVTTDNMVQKRSEFETSFENFYILCMDNNYACQLSPEEQSSAMQLTNKVYLALMNLRSTMHLDTDSDYAAAQRKLIKEMNTITAKLAVAFTNKTRTYTTQQLVGDLENLNKDYLNMLQILKNAISDKVKQDYDLVQHEE